MPRPGDTCWSLITFILAVCWALASSAVGAQEPEVIDEGEAHDSGWEVYLDNDAFALLPLDQDYTGGLAVTLYGKRVTQYPFGLETLRRRIDQWSGSEQRYRAKNTFTLHSFGFGYTAFTPMDISSRIRSGPSWTTILTISSLQRPTPDFKVSWT